MSTEESELQALEHKKAELNDKIQAKRQAALQAEQERKSAESKAARLEEQAGMDAVMFDQTNQEVEKILTSIGPSIKDPKTIYIYFYLMTRPRDPNMNKRFVDSYFRHANKIKDGK